MWTNIQSRVTSDEAPQADDQACDEVGPGDLVLVFEA